MLEVLVILKYFSSFRACDPSFYWRAVWGGMCSMETIHRDGEDIGVTVGQLHGAVSCLMQEKNFLINRIMLLICWFALLDPSF